MLGILKIRAKHAKIVQMGREVLGVVTGTLQKYSREEIEELITRHGGHAASSVSKNTDYLIAGEKAGSKLAKAEQLGVPVIGEEEIERLFQA